MKQNIFLVTIILSMVFLGGCAYHKTPAKPQNKMFLVKTSFANLKGWAEDNQIGALKTLQKTCEVIVKKDPQNLFDKKIVQSGTIAEWQHICAAIDDVDKNDVSSVREFFETRFTPYHVYNNSDPKGLFTGYYLPTLNCSFKKSKRYNVPMHAIPEDWVKVNLGVFDNRLNGRTFIGQVKNHEVYRYPERKNILKGKIAKNSKVLVWCDSKIDVFFAQVQGSTYAKLPNKKKLLLGYEGSNGRPYTALGKVLVQSGELAPEHSSMQDIRAWTLRNPKKVDSFLNKNASYVFFRILDMEAPLGAQQVQLTAERSLAVDRRFIPLGVPVWLDTTYQEAKTNETQSLRRLFIAQDTGGAIKGVVRGDVYWGGGERAAAIAGNMKSQGEYWILLPK